MGPNMSATVVTPDEWKRMWKAADNSSVKAACIENCGPHGRREPILDAFKQLSDAFGELVSKEALDLNMANTVAELLDAHREFLLVFHDPILQKMEHYLPGLQQEVRLCLIGRSEYWKGRAQEHGFVADAQALQKSVTCKSPTDEIFAAGGNSPEGIRRLIESGGEGLSPAVQEVFRGARQILLGKAWATEQKVATAEKSGSALSAAKDGTEPKRRRGPRADSDGHRRVAEILSDGWEQDIQGALRLLDSPPDGRPPVVPSPHWQKTYKIETYSEIFEHLDNAAIEKHIARRLALGRPLLPAPKDSRR